MKLTLCTSLYNSERFLNIFIKSIESQTYQNWELLISDDCSNDSTKKNIKDKIKENSKIFLIENKINLGLTRSLINLLKKVDENGYIVRLDDDEIHSSEYLISVACLFNKGHDLIVYTDFPFLASIISRLHTKNKFFASLLLALIGNIGTHGGTSFTNQLYIKSGGYSKSIYLAQDYHLLIRLIQNSKKPIFINSLNFKSFEIPRLKNKLSKDERLLQNIFSLISISALFSEENKNKRISFPIYLLILIISLPIRFLRSIIYKII